MRVIKRITVFLFSILILIPILKFNFAENAVSEIDNRKLTENPFKNLEGDISSNIVNYVNDRIGFRNEMILAYTVLNDKLFGKMVHPSYTYGKDGYVFGAGVSTNIRYGEFHESFVNMIEMIQKYCNEREIPFLFVFNPAKPAVMSEYIAEGINYNREWVDVFFEELDKRDIRYLDNTETLKEAKNNGEVVFNKKFDANHWNYRGAYYGTNAILEELKKYFYGIHINTGKDVVWSEKKEDSLLVSKFPIDEMVPVANIDMTVESKYEEYKNELELDKNYSGFGYYLNPERQNEGSPKVLVFQGSYMNGKGSLFLQNAFGEYIHVHDYQNVLNFPYYMNIFKPDCVVFEVAEYTLTDNYFNLEKMRNLDFQSPYKSFSSKSVEIVELDQIGDVSVEEGKTLTKIEWTTDAKYDNIWLIHGDEEYDLLKTDTGYTVTILSDVYKQFQKEMKLAIAQES